MNQSETENEEQHEPCPTPLAWQDVVREVEAHARYQQFEAPGGQIRVREFGEGKPVVILPGTQSTARHFYLTAWLLREEYRCIMFDHAEWQRTISPERVIGESASIIGAVMEHLTGDEPPHLYGSTYGAQVAIELLRHNPNRFQDVIFQSGWAYRPLTASERGLLRVGRRFPLAVRWLPSWRAVQIRNHRDCFPPFDQTRFEFLVNEMRLQPTREVALRLLAASSTDLRPRLGDIALPAMVLRCEGEGPAIESLQNDLESGLPQARTEWMHTSGLFPYLTHPHRIVKILRQFWESDEKAAS